MSNSSLVKYIHLSPNHSGKRTAKIDTITPHCVVGQLTASGIASCFPAGRKASCNYGIGKDGSVALIVDEANRSWCTSSNYNDQRAVTIECASDRVEPYAFNDSVYNKLVDLCVDICQRNGKNKLIWFDNKARFISYKPASNEMMLSVHRWFANKSCPGDWMYSRMGQLAQTVTQRLSGSTTPSPTPTKELYRVRKTWADVKSQIGAYSVLDNAKKKSKDTGFPVFNSAGVQVYPTSTPTPSKTAQQGFNEIMAGKYGNGPKRTKRMIAAGYDTATITAAQKLVNQYYK